MKAENLFEVSKEVVEISNLYKSLSQSLVANFNFKTNRNLFIEIDFAPNAGLNAFQISNGSESAKTIIKIAKTLNQENYLTETIVDNSNWIDSTWAPSYSLGEKVGLWKRVKENDYEKMIDWSKPFCVKNNKGLTKIWHPCSRKIFKTGFATRSSIIKFIKEEVAYIQPFYSPLPIKNNRLWHSIYRLVFFSDGQNEPELVGGLVISRQGFKIYPGPGSIVGLIKI